MISVNNDLKATQLESGDFNLNRIPAQKLLEFILGNHTMYFFRKR